MNIISFQSITGTLCIGTETAQVKCAPEVNKEWVVYWTTKNRFTTITCCSSYRIGHQLRISSIKAYCFIID